MGKGVEAAKREEVGGARRVGSAKEKEPADKAA